MLQAKQCPANTYKNQAVTMCWGAELNKNQTAGRRNKEVHQIQQEGALLFNWSQALVPLLLLFSRVMLERVLSA